MKKTTLFETPLEGVKGLQQNWKADIVSGFLVFLIALPLCLAISLASGFPPISGILTAIVGGMFVTLFQGSHLTIKGPAAGMIAIVLGSVMDLGYETTLAVIVASSVIQVLLGLFRSGKLGDFFPSSAVHGLLAAIGVIIMSKQIYILLGVKPEATNPISLILELPKALLHLNPEVAFIGVLGLIVLFTLPNIKNKYINKIPAPMLVLLISIPLGYYFQLETEHTYLFNGEMFKILPRSVLVPLPENVLEGLKFPNFAGLFNGKAVYWIVMFAMVGSLESLLSTKAVDILDPYKRKSNLNKDMLAVGLGNIICGFLGALPMISEIVRSSANINNGAKTKWSNFFHGLFILLFVALFPVVIRHIPMSALASMLCFTGFRLASPKVFKETYKVGKEQLIIFVTTLIVTLATDLILGIFSGIAMKFIIHIIQGAPLKSLFVSNVVVESPENGYYTLKVSQAAVFSNYLGFKRKLDSLPAGSQIKIDLSNAKLIDHTTMEHIHHYGEDYARAGGKLSIAGLEKFKSLSAHPLSYRVAKKNSEESKSRQEVLRGLANELNFSFIESYPAVQTNYVKVLNDDKVSVKYEGNILVGRKEQLKYSISDISLVEGGSMKAQISQITILSVSGFPFSLPQFSMKKEVFMDRIVETTMNNGDIDFSDFPDFSSAYKLSGDNEKEIRKLFNKSLIQFFEKNPLYEVECLGKEIIISKPEKMLNPEEIKQLVDFGMSLANILELKYMIDFK